jgi:hypothetical protein
MVLLVLFSTSDRISSPTLSAYWLHKYLGLISVFVLHLSQNIFSYGLLTEGLVFHLLFVKYSCQLSLHGKSDIDRAGIDVGHMDPRVRDPKC